MDWISFFSLVTTILAELGKKTQGRCPRDFRVLETVAWAGTVLYLIASVSKVDGWKCWATPRGGVVLDACATGLACLLTLIWYIPKGADPMYRLLVKYLREAGQPPEDSEDPTARQQYARIKDRSKIALVLFLFFLFRNIHPVQTLKWKAVPEGSDAPTPEESAGFTLKSTQ